MNSTKQKADTKINRLPDLKTHHEYFEKAYYDKFSSLYYGNKEILETACKGFKDTDIKAFVVDSAEVEVQQQLILSLQMYDAEFTQHQKWSTTNRFQPRRTI